jgi:hypothetical protein
LRLKPLPPRLDARPMLSTAYGWHYFARGKALRVPMLAGIPRSTEAGAIRPHPRGSTHTPGADRVTLRTTTGGERWYERLVWRASS